MNKVCHNASSIIFDDNNNWVWKADGKPEQVFPKADYPLFPLSAIVKWGMSEDDISLVDELRKKALCSI